MISYIIGMVGAFTFGFILSALCKDHPSEDVAELLNIIQELREELSRVKDSM